MPRTNPSAKAAANLSRPLSERRSHLILVGLIGLALVAAGLLAFPGSPFYKKPILGLDLQGGLEVVLKAVPPEGRPLRESDLNRSVEIIRDRIDKLGVSEPEVRKQGEDQISASLAGVENPGRVKEIIGSTARLELFDLQPSLARPSIDRNNFPVPSPTLYALLSSAGTQALLDDGGKPGPYYLFRVKGKKLVAGPQRTREGLLALEKVRKLSKAGQVPKGHKVFAVPPDTRVITCGADQAGCPGVNEDPSQNYFYLFKFEPNAKEPIPQMTGEDLRLQGTRQDFDPQTGQAVVLMSFSDAGEEKFHDVTRAEARRGRVQYNLIGRGSGDAQAFFQSFAIVLDNEIQSFPTIDFNRYPDGIGGENGAEISGIGNVREAKDLALVLQTGALPVEFVTLSETQISATLGEDSLRQALIAAIIGLIVVALFLLLVYRFLGLVAVLGLGIYGALLYAIILIFGVTLTLPGFAGMVLTIGVAADANIVIFERIKEEARAGKSVRAAISAGYGKGFATIVDANVVTAITALILFALATAGVRGFAFLLLLGTAVSVVTAVFATRALLGLLAGFKWFDNPAFMGASAREIPAWQRIDIIGRRRIWFSIASVLIVLSIGSIAVKGLNLGIDFEGGSETAFTTPRAVQIDDVRAEARRIGQEKAQIQGLGEEAANGGYREFQVTTESLAPDEQQRLVSSLKGRFDAESQGARSVSASFSNQILRGALYAMIFSFVLITLYITLRFQWRFAVPIVRTIVNDGLIAVGVYSISGREVSAGTVAAFLTIIGYSIYDTIIIFDRVRENLGLMRRATVKQIVNVSLWETIPRSLATTFITLLPVGALFVFGGETLKDFAFAILIGIGVSAFSTIFIAAPFLGVLLERSPDFRRRRVDSVSPDEPEILLEDAEAAAADEPVPALAPLLPSERRATNEAKRERRRQRRRARPHGRAR